MRGSSLRALKSVRKLRMVSVFVEFEPGDGAFRDWFKFSSVSGGWWARIDPHEYTKHFEVRPTREYEPWQREVCRGLIFAPDRVVRRRTLSTWGKQLTRIQCTSFVLVEYQKIQLWQWKPSPSLFLRLLSTIISGHLGETWLCGSVPHSEHLKVSSWRAFNEFQLPPSKYQSL